MFRIILSCISQLWDVLCESLSSSAASQTPPSSSPSHSIPSTDIPQAPSSTVSNSLASTSSQTPSSSASYSTRWDVFLSFRGSDTRNKFTSHLYDKLDSNGIQTFKDDPELRRGEVISDALLDAIRKSKSYIVVLSENYASSSWCLDELAEILSCHKTLHRLVIPVFYNIDPSIVRHQTGSFKQAFKKHHVRLVGETEKVNNWQLTLTEVASFSGYHISEDRSEADVLNEIVEELLPQINPKTLDVTKFPVGLDSRVEAITTLLSIETNGVIKFGIYGMGGVGKTTLAKALYNKLLGGRSFKGSCFLANVREISGTAKGLVSLQQQLINDVLNSKTKVEVHNVDQGINCIRERISSAKVLVLIDDIYDLEHYESLAGPFASGSVVIITTRDEEMLDKVKVEQKYRYMLKELDGAQSWELFTKHAFEMAEPDNHLLALSKDILGLAGGLPLALKIFGSHLSTKKEVGWKSYIETLQKNPNSTIEQKLAISLDALESDDLKKIFIDIACFFIGWKKGKAIKVMETYYSYTEDKIDTLKKRCLLTVNYRNELEMHDLLRDTGRKVAHNSAPEEPGKHSRLWLPEGIRDVLKNHKGTEAIEGIIPHNLYYQDALQGESFFSETFQDEIEGESFSTKIFTTETFQDVIEGESFSTETFKWMIKLRFLYLKKVNLTGSFEKIFEDLRVFCWDWSPLKCLPSDFNPKKLVILELRWSNMRTMWDVNMVSHVFGKLKTLNMSYSQNLITTPDFVKLPCLEALNLEGCKSLEEVHTSIGSLARLDSLNLQGCEKLRSLPDTICNLRALKVLNISECNSLETFPVKLCNIESLRKLNAVGLSVSNLPDSIGSLTKLVELDLSKNKKLETLPDTICNLRSLEILNIAGCTSLEAMPIQLGNIKFLTKLNADSLTVSKLPESIGHLTKLHELNLSNNLNLESLPDTICNLRFLEILDVSGCSNLAALPTAIGNLESLTMLNADSLTVSKLPDSIGHLSKLVALDLSNNKKLETLPDTICNLRSLEIGNLHGCEKIEILPDQLWKITSLRNLYASWTYMLKKLPDIGSSHIALPLQILNLHRSGITTLPFGFSQLSNLQELDIGGCKHLFSIPKLPPSLICIQASGCESLERLPNLSNLKNLESLDLSFCSGLIEILALKELTALRNLYLTGCSNLTYIQGLDELTSIRWIRLGSWNSLHFPTKRLFQIYSEFEEEITISVDTSNFLLWRSDPDPQWPDWMIEPPFWTSESRNSESTTVYAHLLPNESHNFMGIVLCFSEPEAYINFFSKSGCSVKNTTSGFIWRSDNLHVPFMSVMMVIVPKSKFLISDDHHRIEVTADHAKVIGIHLLYKTKPEMIEDGANKHETSFDALKLADPVLQDIFLDIACFFINWKKEEVVSILETYYPDVDGAIDILKNRCVLTVNDEDVLEMNDLLQHTGRKIARNNSLDEPGKHSRLWLSIDIYDMLKKHTGTERIKSIIPRNVYSRKDALEGECFTSEAFKKMSKLRFLYLKNVNFSGSFEQTFEDLRWLRWDSCTLKCLPSAFHPPKLVTLELPNSNIRTMWEPNMASQVYEKLKTLNMSFSQDLTTTPDFNKLPCLVTLNLQGCISLEEVHISIGCLVRLVSLDLHGCVKLKTLPHTIRNLRALKVLDIHDCFCLEALPVESGSRKSPKEVVAENLTVSKSPDSIEDLSKLVQMRSNTNLETLTDIICNLRALEILNISGCGKLEILLNQLFTLTSLRELNASGATLLKIHPHIGEIQMALSLQKLDFSDSALTSLPSAIGQLPNVEYLDLKDCRRLLSITELPPNLKSIRAHGCKSLQRFPNLSDLKHLEILELTDCSGLSDIQGLKGLTSIRTLHLEGCNSTFVAFIFTKCFFQAYSEFCHPVQISASLTEFPYWIRHSSENGSTMCLDWLPNVSRHFLGMILCFKSLGSSTNYTIKNTTSDFIWSGSFYPCSRNALMVIVPRSIFSVSDGDNKIELTTEDAKIYGIHLLYEN